MTTEQAKTTEQAARSIPTAEDAGGAPLPEGSMSAQVAKAREAVLAGRARRLGEVRSSDPVTNGGTAWLVE
jgi:hypothetical protein